MQALSMDRHGILVIQSLGLGDVLFALPSLAVLKRHYPAEPVGFLTSAQYESLLSLVPKADEILCYRNKTIPEVIRLLTAVRRRRYRLAVVLNPVFRGSLLAWLCGIPIRVGYVRDYERQQSLYGFERLLLTHSYAPCDRKLHEVERYLDLLSMFGLDVREGDHALRLVLTDEAREFGQSAVRNLKGARQGPVIAINPGAGWDMRRWPARCFALIGDWLCDRFGATVLFVGTPGEAGLIETIRGQMARPSRSFAGETTLARLAGLLASCDLFLTNDTGPLHIAAALDVPTIALFGPGDLAKVRPLSSRAIVLYHPIPCSPCRVQYTDKCRDNICMRQIAVDEVKAAIAGILGKTAETKVICASVGSPDHPRRVLYLQSTSEIGGSDVSLMRIIEKLDQRRFLPHVVLPSDGPLVGELRMRGCSITFCKEMLKMTTRKGRWYLLRYLINYPRAVWKILQIIRRERIDLVHTNSLHNLYGFLAATMSGRPHVWHVREIVVQSQIVRAVEVFLARHFADRIIVTSDTVGEVFDGGKGPYPSRLRKIPNGIDLARYRPGNEGRGVLEEQGIAPDAPVVGLVCRLDRWKGVDTFLYAVALCRRECPQARYLVVGGPVIGQEDYADQVQALSKALHVDDVVTFTGWRYQPEDMPKVHAALSMLVLASSSPEPFGLVLLEAMATAKPVVATNEGGPREICVDGETAILVPPRDPEKMAQAIIALLRDPARARAMGAAGRARVERLYDQKQTVSALQSLYDEILETRT